MSDLPLILGSGVAAAALTLGFHRVDAALRRPRRRPAPRPVLTVVRLPLTQDLAAIGAALGEPVDAADTAWCDTCGAEVPCAAHADGSASCWGCHTRIPAAR